MSDDTAPASEPDPAPGRVRLRHADLEFTVETRCPAGHAQIHRCHPVRLRNGYPTPFPTLFWLVCPTLVKRISRLEHEGLTAIVDKRMQTDAGLREAMAADHAAYVEERWAELDDAERAAIREHGLEREFRERGIGGMENWSAVKCLHAHYAHHLARGNAIGAVVDEIATIEPCGALRSPAP